MLFTSSKKNCKIYTEKVLFIGKAMQITGISTSSAINTQVSTQQTAEQIRRQIAMLRQQILAESIRRDETEAQKQKNIESIEKRIQNLQARLDKIQLNSQK